MMSFITTNWEYLLLALYVVEKVIKLSPSKKDDLVLDPYSGSGNICIAAYGLERKFTGIEIDKKYFDESIKSLENYKKRLKFFKSRRIKYIC